LDIFSQSFSIGAFWDKDECFKFWGQKNKVQGHGESNMLKNARSGLANFWTDFHQTFSVDAFWYKDEIR